MSRSNAYWMMLGGAVAIATESKVKEERKQCRFNFNWCKGTECDKKTKRCS